MKACFAEVSINFKILFSNFSLYLFNMFDNFKFIFNFIKMPFPVFFNLTLFFLISCMEEQLKSHFGTHM